MTGVDIDAYLRRFGLGSALSCRQLTHHLRRKTKFRQGSQDGLFGEVELQEVHLAIERGIHYPTIASRSRGLHTHFCGLRKRLKERTIGFGNSDARREILMTIGGLLMANHVIITIPLRIHERTYIGEDMTLQIANLCTIAGVIENARAIGRYG